MSDITVSDRKKKGLLINNAIPSDINVAKKEVKKIFK
jgi:hypothetical protein